MQSFLTYRFLSLYIGKYSQKIVCFCRKLSVFSPTHLYYYYSKTPFDCVAACSV